MPVRIEEIIQRIRREIAEGAEARGGDAPPAELDRLPAISARPELEYLNRHWALFDPLAEMRSHRRFFGPVVLRFRWMFRRLVLGVLDRYFEKERAFLLELVRFENALAERSDRLLREVTERTKAVAQRNDLFLGALDLRLEAIEAREEMRRALEHDEPARAAAGVSDGSEAAIAELALGLGVGLAERVRAVASRLPAGAPVLVLGCGSGEAFDALDGAASSGVEASASLVAAARARGFDAAVASLAGHLESLPEESIGALVVTRVSDRHPLAAWPRLVAGAWRALRPGGVAIFEGLGDGREAARFRWLLARQRFAIVDARSFPGIAPGVEEHVLVARRAEAA